MTRTHDRLQGKPAFTLIELLIVVAIIAILAAIAVPNFLEAQTRAKISRNMADMRTVSVGLESYRVDYSKYPEKLLSASTYLGRLVGLTTPVPYLTSIPQDVFKLSSTTARSQKAAPYIFANLTFDYFTLNEFRKGSGGGTIEFHDQAGKMIPSEYQVRGWGPDLDNDSGGINPEQIKNNAGPVPYDPTNGTISNGDIKLFGPGTLYNK